MRRDQLLAKIESLKATLRKVEQREKDTIRDIQISALKAEILKAARNLEQLDRSI